MFAPVNRCRLRRFEQPLAGFGRRLGRRKIEERYVVDALEVRPQFLKRRTTLRVDEPGQGIRKYRVRIGPGRGALRVDEHRPPGSQAFERIVNARRDSDELVLGRAVQVRAAKTGRALKGAVLVENNPRRDQSSPGQEVCEAFGSGAVFGETHHVRNPKTTCVSYGARTPPHTGDRSSRPTTRGNARRSTGAAPESRGATQSPRPPRACRSRRRPNAA